LDWKENGGGNDDNYSGGDERGNNNNNDGATTSAAATSATKTIGHKFTCNAYKRVGEDMIIPCTTDREEIRHEILTKIRFYAYPYAVFTAQQNSTTYVEGGGGVGDDDNNNNTINSTRGFLFIQSDSSLAVMSLPVPILSSGHAYPHCRSVILHYLTVNEFITEVCNRHDFELTCLTNELRDAVETYNEMIELVILMRFRCGHVALGIVSLVPDYNLCLVLGKEYYGAGEIGQPVQLNIDDM
jgi:hypothetical protein